MLSNEIVEGGPLEAAVDDAGEFGALRDGVFGAAAVGAGEELAGQFGAGDEVVEVVDLFCQVGSPGVAVFVEDGACGVQGDAELLHDLDQDEAAELLDVVHARAAASRRRLDQPSFFVVAQGRGVHPQSSCRLPDADQGHGVS